MSRKNNAESSSLLIKVTEDDEKVESIKQNETEVAMTQEEVLEKAFEQFYKSGPKSNSPKRNSNQLKRDSKQNLNGNTSRGTDESQEVILSPGNFHQSNEKPLPPHKEIDRADEESLDKHLREEGLASENFNDGKIEQLQTKMERSAE